MVAIMFSPPSPFLLLTLLGLPHPTLAKSQIALFSDTNCQNTLRGVEGPNGYPNGTCTDLRRSGPYGSFHVVGLDPGCMVTIYADNTSEDICSGHQEEIQMVDCYNSTYIYYSIDFCDPGAAKGPPLSPSQVSTSKTPTGAIVGGVVGGVVALGIIICIVVMCIVRKRRARKNVDVAEVHGRGRAELEPQELYTGRVKYECAAVEIERSPAELDGAEMREERVGAAY